MTIRHSGPDKNIDIVIDLDELAYGLYFNGVFKEGGTLSEGKLTDADLIYRAITLLGGSYRVVEGGMGHRPWPEFWSDLPGDDLVLITSSESEPETPKGAKPQGPFV